MSADRLPTSILDYALDPGRVAREPVVPRDAARMMVVHRADDRVEHRLVRDLPEYLRPHDVLVVNRTHVMAARLKLRRIGDGRVTEALLESPRSDRCWRAFLLHTKRFKPGDRFELVPPESDPAAAPPAGSPAVVRLLGRAGDGVELLFEGGGDGPSSAAEPSMAPVASIVERAGWTPLPPYIRRAREVAGSTESGRVDRRDRDDYQTVYARPGGGESIAAPTAGLHFTPELLAAIDRLGVRRTELSLQIGPGTFKPVETEFLDDHPIHSEHFEIPASTLELLRAVEPRRRSGDVRIIAVGTTSVRALESLPDPLPAPASPSAGAGSHGSPSAGANWSAETSLMILPTTRIRRVDVLLTNFHLPRSSLLSLVAAFTGVERLLRLYDLAQREGYRFYSYGDAMLIL